MAAGDSKRALKQLSVIHPHEGDEFDDDEFATRIVASSLQNKGTGQRNSYYRSIRYISLT